MRSELNYVAALKLLVQKAAGGMDIYSIADQIQKNIVEVRSWSNGTRTRDKCGP
jgi:hypothetical protein